MCPARYFKPLRGEADCEEKVLFSRIRKWAPTQCEMLLSVAAPRNEKRTQEQQIYILADVPGSHLESIRLRIDANW